MNLTTNSYYKIVVSVGDKILTYFAKIISVSDFITFEDKFGEFYSYNKLNVVSYKSLSDDEIKLYFKKDIENGR